jgi:protein TonB
MDKDEIKKTPRANIENQKDTAILMGVVLALALVFVAFEWSTQTTKVDLSTVVQDVVAEEEIEITRRDPTPPPPPPPPAPEAPEIIQVVETKVETRIDINMEDDQSKAQIQTYTPPPPPKEREEEEEEIFVVV